MFRKGFHNNIVQRNNHKHDTSHRRKRWLLLAIPFVIFFAVFMIWVVGSGDEAKNNTGTMKQAIKGNWIGTWAASPQPPSDKGLSHDGIHDQTIREIVHPHLDGNKLRIRLSNRYGADSVTFDEVHVAVKKDGSSIKKDTDHQVTFEGDKSVTIPEGEETYSDPVSMPVKAGRDIAVSIYIQGDSGPATYHGVSLQSSYISPSGNHTKDSSEDAFKKTKETDWYWLTGIDVKAKSSVKGAIVVLGSSITNGNHSTQGKNQRWPDDLARRFNQRAPDQQMSVLNEGLSANRLLEGSSSNGESAISRLSKDVFDQSGVKALILLEGINDIRHHPDIDADKVISGMKKIIAKTHAQGLKIYGGTLTPFKGSGMYTEKGEKTREKVNHWIRNSKAFDGVIDFDKAVRDPKNPKRFLPKYGYKDHFHPSDEGYQAMADAVDLSMFK